MKNSYEIRLIKESDAPEILEIYKPFVLHTVISFEYEVPSVEEYRQRIIGGKDEFPWLVCLSDNKIIGYAYAGKYRGRKAYQWNTESTLYLAPEFQRKGIARILYETLFAILRFQGYINVYAIVGLPNDKSIGFHKKMGFEEIGIIKKDGFKHGKWRDTQWLQLNLTDHHDNPPAPLKIIEVSASLEFKTILDSAKEKAGMLNQSFGS